MSSTNKHGKYYFGLKMHTGVDVNTGIIHSLEVSTAKVHDKQMMALLLHGEEKAVFGDKGYASEKDKFYARDAGVYWGILDKCYRNRQLSNKQQKRNKKLASIRSKVEFPFLIIKRLWGHKKVRYRGLAKNLCQWQMLTALSNLYQMRKRLKTMA